MSASVKLPPMNIALHPARMTQEEFFAWAESQEGRYEFDGFQPVAMTGGSADHDRIRFRIHSALDRRLGGSPCEPFGPDMGITVGIITRYPDVLVNCTRFPGKDRVAPDPIVVFEVVSPSSKSLDHDVKAGEYHAVPSIQHYVIIGQDEIRLTVFGRQDGPAWLKVVLTGADGILRLSALGIEIPVEEFYQGVAFEAPQQAEG